MYTANEILSKVNEYINNLTYDRKPQSLYEPIKYVLSLGGKRIRPTLMLLSYNLFKDDPETILSPACALETYHNYTLLHDDLMDDAPLRRGQQTVHVRWDANTAILSGDSMLVLAFERMAQCDSRHLSEVLRLFTVTALEIGEGQQYDMEFENRNDVKEEEYIEMIRLKTSVLLACAMKIGAILADAPTEDEEKVAAVTELYNSIGVDKMAIERINYYFDEANKYIAAVNLPDERKAELLAYAQKMLHRKW